MGRNKNFASFVEVRDFVRQLRLKSANERNNYRKNRPIGIPCEPHVIYKNSGWIDWYDFLGHKRDQRKYAVNENYFKKWSRDMAYIFGFWFADGCISGKCFRIDQHKNDKYLLSKILLTMESEQGVSESGNMSRISIYSKIIVEDIKRLGGKERKSLDVKFPCIPKKYLPDFVRGFFDGDGWICFNSHDKTFEAGFCSGSKDFIYGLFHVLKKEIPKLAGRISKRANNGGYSGKTLYLINFGKNDTIRLKKFMYNSPSFLFLKRKYDLFQKTGEITRLKNGQCINYIDAIKYVHSLKLNSRKEWIKFCQSGKKRYDVPCKPGSVYKNSGWVSWGKWLGTNRIADQFKIFMPFNKALKIIRKDVIKYNLSLYDWAAYRREHKNPYIPSHPDVSYKNKGWVSWSHFFGKNRKNRKNLV